MTDLQINKVTFINDIHSSCSDHSALLAKISIWVYPLARAPNHKDSEHSIRTQQHVIAVCRDNVAVTCILQYNEKVRFTLLYNQTKADEVVSVYFTHTHTHTHQILCII